MTRTREAGKSLIEMVIVIALISVVIGMATTTLGTLFRIKQQITNDLDQDRTLMRLASHLRADAHAALQATIDNGCDLLMADGRSIRYRLVAPEITREVTRDQETVHRDSFRLPRDATAVFSLGDGSETNLLRVSIKRADAIPRAHATPVRSMSIAAAVNLHRQPPAGEEQR